MDQRVEPASLREGEPQLTMTTIQSLHDLGPFFASVCRNVSRQQAKRALGATGSPRRTSEVIDAILERDFLEGAL